MSYTASPMPEIRYPHLGIWFGGIDNDPESINFATMQPRPSINARTSSIITTPVRVVAPMTDDAVRDIEQRVANLLQQAEDLLASLHVG